MALGGAIYNGFLDMEGNKNYDARAVINLAGNTFTDNYTQYGSQPKVPNSIFNAGVSFVYNIMDRSRFQANDVSLPNFSVNPFVRYGIGVRKTWGERLTGHFQTYFTNGGRNGIGLSAGLRWAIGKKGSGVTKGQTPELKPTKITLNNHKG